MQEQALRAFLQEVLPKKRYQHSLGVEETAVALAERYGANVEQARLAGLLHDCAKSYDNEATLEAALRYGMKLDAVYAASPQLLHGAAGAYRAREELGIEDEAVLHAICYHTIPDVQMGLLDKIVFIADMMEPNRNYPGVEDLREAASHSLEEAYLLSLSRTIIHVTERRQLLHLSSVEAYNALLWNQLEKRP